MKLVIVVNDVDTEHPRATTTLLAYTAHHRGHDVHMIGVGELTCRTDNHVTGITRVPTGNPRRPDTFLKTVQGDDAERGSFSTEDTDVLWLRYNPVEEMGETAWARHAGFQFGQLAVRKNVLVLSHPFTLPYAINKTYLHHFPEFVRPRTIITRSTEELRKFYEENGERIVLKPLEGYGGADVFTADHDEANLTQMMDAVRRSGYMMAQEFLPEAPDGDIRLFLMNGRPLQVDGHYCAIRRIPPEGDFRSNLSAGGVVARADITPDILELADALRPKLIEDGLFLCGVDIVGSKIVEVNTISAGAMQACQRTEGVDFGAAVIESIERKVAHRRTYENTLSNRKLAVLE